MRKRTVAAGMTTIVLMAGMWGCRTGDLRTTSTVGDRPTESELYMVIDLSGGPSAPSAPVSYLSGVPVGGWTDEYKTTKLVMRRIPAGTFTMGERSTDYPGASDDGLHQVTLTKDFYIGVFEVTQKQWEYACRAGTTTALNSGKNLTATASCPNMSEVGRYNGGYTEGCYTIGGTAQAGSHLPNVWGLYDMHGNVWEWGLDWYGAYPGSVQDPLGAASGSARVIRGGSWDGGAYYCRSAVRDYGRPDYRFNYVGFRAASTLP